MIEIHILHQSTCSKQRIISIVIIKFIDDNVRRTFIAYFI